MTIHNPPLHRYDLEKTITAIAAAIALPADGRAFDNSEEHALARRAAHDMTAFSQIYRRYVRRIYAYHLARTGNVEDAQDLTSQTFIAALESIPRFRGDGSLAAWLFGIAHHKINDHYRNNRVELPLDVAETLHQPGGSLEDAAHVRMQLDQISRLLGQISPDRAEAILLTVFGGLSVLETCHVLEKRESAVRVLIFRGLQDLRARIDREGETHEKNR